MALNHWEQGWSVKFHWATINVITTTLIFTQKKLSILIIYVEFLLKEWFTKIKKKFFLLLNSITDEKNILHYSHI